MPDNEGDVLKRVHRADNAIELNAAAKHLSRIRDARNHEVSRYLQEGEKIYKAYVNDGKIKRTSEGAAKFVIEEDNMNDLPTKHDLKRIISNRGVEEDTVSVPPANMVPPPVSSIIHCRGESSTELMVRKIPQII